MPTRREILKGFGTLVLAPFIPFDAVKLRQAGVIPVSADGSHTLRTAKGQTIVDMMISFGGVPADVNHVLTFFRRSNPEQELFKFALNQRGILRWCAPPKQELFIPAGDALCWRQQSFPASDRPEQPIIWTQGHDLANGRLVVNQRYYADRIEWDRCEQCDAEAEA